MSDTGRSVTAMIADKLRTGLIHPGDPARDQPAKPVIIPGLKPTAGMPQQMAEQVSEAATMIAEAIVALIETDYTINTKQIHDTVPPDDSVVTLRCRHKELFTFNPSRPVDCTRLHQALSEH